MSEQARTTLRSRRKSMRMSSKGLAGWEEKRMRIADSGADFVRILELAPGGGNRDIARLRRGKDPIVQWPRTPPFHGGNTGSNPVRVAPHFSSEFLGNPHE